MQAIVIVPLQASDQPLPLLEVGLLDWYNQTVQAGTDATAEVAAGPPPLNQTLCDLQPALCPIVLGTTLTQAVAGVAAFNQSLRVRAMPGLYNISFTATLPRIQRVLPMLLVEIAVRVEEALTLMPSAVYSQGQLTKSDEYCLCSYLCSCGAAWWARWQLLRTAACPAATSPSPLSPATQSVRHAPRVLTVTCSGWCQGLATIIPAHAATSCCPASILLRATQSAGLARTVHVLPDLHF
jgi:hypothetical protein